MPRVAKQWFLIGLALCLLLAWLWPAGWLPSEAGERWLRRGCVALIFFTAGLTLRSRAILRGIGHWRLHLLVQGLSLGVAPLLFWALDPLWAAWGLSPGLRHGLLILGCVPTTVSSCVALTALAHGNEAGALVNATLGNLLGVVITPLWILLLLGEAATFDLAPVLLKLGGLVLLPVLLGQLVQVPLQRWIDERRKTLSQCGQALVLVILFLALARSLNRPQLAAASTIGLLIALTLVLHLALLGTGWWLAAACRMARGDRIAGALCASQKTIALGVPLIAVLFVDTPDITLLLLPLIVYHPLQLLVDGLLVAVWARHDAQAGAAR